MNISKLAMQDKKYQEECNRIHPYYIYAPDFVTTSAGVKALYMLCDRLNYYGYPAYIVSNKTTDKLNAPILPADIKKKHFKNLQDPIVIYPETIPGNPLHAKFYVRYYFCYHRHFGVDLTHDKPNLIYSFSKDLCDEHVNTNHIMFIPTIDLTIFYPPKQTVNHKGTCYAAMKYKYFHKEEIFGLPKGAIEITRELPGSQTREEIAELFRHCKYFYCFDNSALALEATLCGCITILMRNKHFTQVIGEQELNGLAGMAWNDDPQGIIKAEKSIQYAYHNYQNVIDQFENNMLDFINITQAAAEKRFKSTKCLIYLSKLGFRNLYQSICIRFPIFTKPIQKAIEVIRG